MTIQELKTSLVHQVPLVIAIDGPSGSGKSTLAKYLQEQYDTMLFHTDDYFLPATRKTEERLEEPGGNLDYERMLEEIFKHIDDPFVTSHKYNCQIEALEVRSTEQRKPIILIEGVYSMHPLFQPYYDVMIYLSVDRQTQLNRILERSNERLLERFKQEWIPLEDRYFEAFSIPETADINLDGTRNLRELF